MTNKEQPTSLDDKKWFKNVHFKEQDTLCPTSEIKLPLLRLLCHLSFPIELLFSATLITLSLLAGLWLVDSYSLASLVVYLPLLIGTLFLKRILIWRKFGFSSKHVMTISKDKIKVNPFINDSLKQSRLFKRDEIESVLFNYSFITHVSDTQIQVNAALNRAFINLKTGENIELNVNRVGLFNVLYLLYYFDYPLIYKKSFEGGGSSIGYIFLRVSGIVANFPIIAMYLAEF
ncbi:hypothetical protein PAT01_03530 [Pseudoalteromonas atlantica]|uniref:DUF304 domain-containing protein n=1 Tax=Pseudoalteromonas atlantica TaxID=288 RepID=A0ABQ0UDG6_PSEAF|nr:MULTISPECIES: hypothetical protein [Pseudoalteromonas]MCK8094198.1 hypothetical protein [Pseudoalteromonas sp. 1CM17D]MCW1717384.1 hypothetical protein [Pseudoalteromonas sp. A3]TMO05140.1 hypothetical protein CWB60_14365 [Pseudoalteromonas sp. S327]TMO20358.1 hypothetical protein CWB59_00870 [Pseudoalteromonas sp. S326]GEK75049.1 hypothetical protein PAT01_03530 [Pseudoalteromonas atlantica]|tara:strand:+ start:553 stop:1248 length:696 start_codon:yes stop_codon:yes gene_type:complete